MLEVAGKSLERLIITKYTFKKINLSFISWNIRYRLKYAEAWNLRYGLKYAEPWKINKVYHSVKAHQALLHLSRRLTNLRLKTDSQETIITT
jgi:hypothetical protein